MISYGILQNGATVHRLCAASQKFQPTPAAHSRQEIVTQAPAAGLCHGSVKAAISGCRQSGTYSAECCGDADSMPCNDFCFASEIVKEYCQLRERHRHTVTKNARLCRLAEPKTRVSTQNRGLHIFADEVLCKVDIVRSNPRCSRTEQLAYPTVRGLSSLQLKNTYSQFSTQRKESVNRLMRKSLHSLYSRLSNTQPLLKKRPIVKWDRKDWADHMKRISYLAMPKNNMGKLKSGPIHKKMRAGHASSKVEGPRPNPRRIIKLSRPKKLHQPVRKEWRLTKKMRFYEPSSHTQIIAAPKMRLDLTTNEHAFHVVKTALSYKASKRILQLAHPRRKHANELTVPENPFQTNRKALKAHPSERIAQLATPNIAEDNHTRANAFTVSPNALRARLTPRLRKLARPKERF